MSNHKKKSEIRDIRIETRLFKHEERKLYEMAKLANMSRSRFLLECILKEFARDE